ncbi:MAG: PAS domain S-box protein, partial [Bacteroidota bacterium]|nr:PAS domain S-box protein [Bacteroidota bacterium]
TTKEFYEKILNSIGADIAVLDDENRHCFLNENAVKNPEIRKWIIGKTNREYCLHRNRPVELADTREEIIRKVEDTGEKVEWLEELTDNRGNLLHMLRIMEPFETNDRRQYKVAYGINITDLITTQNKLAQSESYLNSLFNSIPDLVLRIDADGKYIDIKAEQKGMLALEADKLIGKTLHEIFDKKIADFHLGYIKKALKANHTITYEYQLPVLNKEITFFEARVTKINDMETVSIVRDITKRKEYESRIKDYTLKLKERQEHLTRLITAAPEGIVEIDPSGKILLWNPMCEKIFGWKTGEVKGKIMGEIILTEKRREEYTKGMNGLLKDEVKYLDRTLELTAINKAGEDLFITLTISKLNDRDKTVFIAFVKDVSEKKKAEVALKKRKRQLYEAQQIAKLASFEWDPNTGHVEWSRTFHTILGIPANEKFENFDGLLKYIHPDDLQHFYEAINYPENKENYGTLNFRILTPGGKLKYITAKGMIINSRASASAPVYGTLQDVSEQKLFEQKLFKAVIESEEKERNRIAAELHDGVCQDLAAAKLTLGIAIKTIDQDISQAKKLLTDIHNTLGSALNLTSKVSHELLPGNLKDEGLARSFGNLVKQLNDIDSIKYSLKISGTIKEPESLISVNLYRIAQEFIRNSQKHSGAKNTNISLDFFDHKLVVKLKDDGKGFDSDKVDKNGIGFINMARRVQSIGGKYDLMSKEGEGVMLSLTVPI